MTAPFAPYEPPPWPEYRPPRRGRSGTAVVLASVLAAVLAVIVGVALGQSTLSTVSGRGSLAAPGNGLPGSGLFPGGTPGLGQAGRSGKHGVHAATAAHQVGVVTVVSKLKFQPVESAGTGMILTSDGEVLTNNHVIDGAGTIMVTDELTGRSYSASVVGTAPTRDVALLQLRNASGLRTAPLAQSSSGLSLGDVVTGVGNAKGTGRLTQAIGKITGLHQTITASDAGGQNSERLSGLIQTDAAIVSGDSGGPLYDAAGQIVGMDTAASAQSRTHSGYAIPVENALRVVHAIQTGVETTSIHIGLPGFLGVSIAAHGTRVISLLPGPARAAGISPGSVITSVDGTAVHTGTALHDVLSAKGPGTSVQIGWVDAAGNAHSAAVVLATGPAD